MTTESCVYFLQICSLSGIPVENLELTKVMTVYMLTLIDHFTPDSAKFEIDTFSKITNRVKQYHSSPKNGNTYRVLSIESKITKG